MPAITADTLTLTRVGPAGPADTDRPVRSITTGPRGYEGLGFPVVRAFAGVSTAALDPFVHMDQMGEVEYQPGEPRGTDWHPHRGFETVTYMIDGKFAHQDSHGGGGLITDGATQWMTAGSGILHIETPPVEMVNSGGIFHGIQLWVNLPKRDKFAPPRYQAIEGTDAKLLSSDDGGALIRVIAGEIDGNGGPGVTHTPITMAHATIETGARLNIPWRRDFNALVYVLSGQGSVGPAGAPDQAGPVGRSGAGRPDHRGRATRPVPHGIGRVDPGWPADSRADIPLRTVRDEHSGRGDPGDGGLSIWQISQHPAERV